MNFNGIMHIFASEFSHVNWSGGVLHKSYNLHTTNSLIKYPGTKPTHIGRSDTRTLVSSIFVGKDSII